VPAGKAGAAVNHPHPLQVSIAGLPPEGIDVTVEATSRDLDLPETERTAFPHPFRFRLHVSRVGADILARGVGCSMLRCECDRCLGEYEEALEVADMCHLFESVDEDAIDLTERVREDILLVLPQRLLCSEQCLGLCPSCGQNLNTGACECRDETDADSPWRALDGLGHDANNEG